MLPLADRLLEMIEVPSTTGEEGPYTDLVADYLALAGFDVRRQSVKPGRDNLLAVRGRPRLLFSTHLDTVAPHLPPRREGETIHGRGACDTKGGLAAMLEAASRLDGAAADGLGFLLVVGEEVDHCGALAALDLDLDPVAIVLGEPTENRMARAQKGVLRITIEAEGRAGHSGYPEIGPSAIDRLLVLLGRLRDADWPRHPERGSTTLNIGTIQGGEGANTIAPSARAEILFRLVGPAEKIVSRIETLCPEGVQASIVSSHPPLDLSVIDGWETTVVSFHSDASILHRMAPIHLMGPGDIRLAHSPEERIDLADLRRGVDLYEAAARHHLEER